MRWWRSEARFGLPIPAFRYPAASAISLAPARHIAVRTENLALTEIPR